MTGTCTLSVNIALEWMGQPFEVEPMRHGDNRKQAHLTVNALGKMPAVMLENGIVLTEAADILTWLVNTYPDAALGATSEQPLSRFAIAEALNYLTSDVHTAFGPFFGPEHYSNDKRQYSALQEKSLEQLSMHLSSLDDMLSEHPYMLAAGRSVADAYLYMLMRWADYLPDGIRPFPQLASFRIRMESDGAVQRALGSQKLAPVGG